MIGGNPNEFLESVYSGQDTVFIYKGIKYWCQGYVQDDGRSYMEVFQYQPANEENVWSYTGVTAKECFHAFLDAPIFDGKTFWDAEQEIEWVDD